MGRIQQLDEKTINQIAAGEVVESPSSVLKELVENAVDAGAKQLRLEASNGGFQYLKIIDDGCGMDLDDLQLCVVRHATSKIRSIEDLVQVASLGFRGEALASIAAVSHLKIASCTIGSKEGYQLLFDGSELVISPLARSKGTSVEVSDLFYNVPARKAFQKSASASSADLTRWVGYLALAYPKVAFTYSYNGKQLFSSEPCQSGQALDLEAYKRLCGKVLGQSFADSGLGLCHEREGFKLEGILGDPHEHRANRTGQIWIVNGRVVTSPQLSRAVAEGYGTRLPVSRFAQFVLHLTLPGEWVDVNVHPQKRELRFKDSGLIGSWIAHAVGLHLAKASSAPTSFESSSAMPWDQPSDAKPFEPAPVAEVAWKPYAESFKDGFTGVKVVDSHKSQTLSFDLHLTPLALWKRWSLWDWQQLRSKFEPLDSFTRQRLEGVDLVWMSHSRALARIRYEQALQPTCGVLAQGLLLPIQLEFHLGELEKWRSLESALEACGFEIRQLDRWSLAIDAIPHGMDLDSLKDFFQQLLESEVPKAKDLVKETVALAMARQIERQDLQTKVAPSELILGLLACREKFLSPLGKAIFRPLREEDLEVKAAVRGGEK